MGVAVLVVIALCVWALATLFAVALLVCVWRTDRNDTRRLNALERHLAQEVAIGFDSKGWVRVEDCYGMELGVGGDLRAALDQVDLDDQDLERA